MSLLPDSSDDGSRPKDPISAKMINDGDAGSDHAYSVGDAVTDKEDHSDSDDRSEASAESSETENDNTDHIQSLPLEILTNITGHLHKLDQVCLALSCKHFNGIVLAVHGKVKLSEVCESHWEYEIDDHYWYLADRLQDEMEDIGYERCSNWCTMFFKPAPTLETRTRFPSWDQDLKTWVLSKDPTYSFSLEWCKGCMKRSFKEWMRNANGLSAGAKLLELYNAGKVKVDLDQH